jgi:hypothetical protein
MTESLALPVSTYLHIASLSLWFGGLFGYVVIVWPAIASEAGDAFPRDLFVAIAVRTFPWISLAMATAVLSLVVIWLTGGAARAVWMTVYTMLLLALAANNVYGTLRAWPRIMFLPERAAIKEWYWFRVRMMVSLVVGLALHSVAIVAALAGEPDAGTSP